ncbi:DUF11 domain-containing protein, partial [Candidatus Parcubacteria bacterium]|nr:DUF11 domain-containing protein [Candidatus Parcubacteria bacterium]
KHDVVTCEFYNIDDPCGYSVWGYKYNSDTEAPIAGWEIELVEPTGYPVAATTTDVNGYYYFDGLCEGQYYIEEVLGDWTQDQPVSGYFDVIIPDMYDFYGPYDFWNTPPAGPSTGSITIIKETAISSEVIFEFNGDIGEFELGDTESHTQDGLEASTYYIYEENLQPGWYFADFDCGDAIIIDSDSVGVSIALREGEDVICTFYNIYGEGTIEVCKYEDINGDGEPDYEEYAKASLWDKIKSSIVKTAHAMMPTGYPLGGWIMNIVGDNSHTDSGPTDSGDGCISFTVPYGTYTVSENTQTGWTQTYPTDCGGAPINHTVTIEEGHEYERVYFLNYDDPTYCGDGIVQSPNDDGFYEECDGSAPCGYTCNNDCTLEKESSGGGTLFPTFRGGGTTGQTSSPSTPTVAGEEGAPVLVISKTVDQEIVNVGDEVEYIITVTNNGSLTAFEVNLEDLLPEGLEFVDDESSTKSWDLGDIAPGVSKSATVIVKVTGDITIGTITNTATAEAANHGAVEASADVEIVEVAVLAETGFDLKEFVLMFIGAISLAVLTVGLRRRLLA